MCGINGILYHDRERRPDRGLIEAMNQALVHRGPDDGGIHLDGHLALGHRRLSIIDLASGHQPMCNEDETVWITFNGEIYNYAELREELIAKGHAFKTTSDTEVIVHLYEETRERCVERLRGMFAFGIWDRGRDTLFLARDRLGIKPLYYFPGKDALAFSSEIRGLLQVPSLDRRLNQKALHDYLTFRYTIAPETMIEGVFKLPPGHILLARGGRYDVRQYWDLDFSEKLDLDEDECIEEFQRRFTACTKSHLVGEVPLGVLLSGGLDSSAVTAVVSEETSQPVKTFSVAFADDGDDYDERAYAQLAARCYRTDHHEIAITHRDFVAGLGSYVSSMEEPMADPASIPLYYVSKLARNHVTIILSGEGSDEMLAGYGFDFRGFRRAGWVRRIPGPIRNAVLKPLNDALLHSPRVGRYLELSNLPPSHYPVVVPSYMGGVFSEDGKAAIYGQAMRAGALRAGPSEQRVVDLYKKTTGYPEYVDQVLYVYTKQWLADDLLLKADKMTMAHSLELRVPFLDHSLVEFVARLPVHMKIRPNGNGGHLTKYVLRKAFAGRIPEEILHRKKLGFPVPLKRLFGGEMGDLARDVFETRAVRESGLFDAERVSGLLRENANGHDHGHRLWALLVFGLWYDLFKVTN